MTDAMCFAAGYEGDALRRMVNKFGRAFAVSDDQLCQISHERDERALEGDGVVGLGGGEGGRSRFRHGLRRRRRWRVLQSMSLVEVAPSTEMQLHVLSAGGDGKELLEGGRGHGGIGAGDTEGGGYVWWIMPAPFVMPAMEKVVVGEEGSVYWREASFGDVSVVHMPLAARSQCLWDFPMPWLSSGI